uniref:MADF domain-containing protein n=1 Tax=Heligmosomoides polygyrus TaxID=6339 RepID=A0A183GDS8_HELPZ
LNATLDSCYEVEEVKKQWKNLRDSFQKRMKAAKEPKTGSAAGDPPTKWIFFEAMQFFSSLTMKILSRICDELGTMNHNQQAGDQFDAFGAFAASTLRSLAAYDEEGAKWAVLELTENLTKLVWFARICRGAAD